MTFLGYMPHVFLKSVLLTLLNELSGLVTRSALPSVSTRKRGATLPQEHRFVTKHRFGMEPPAYRAAHAFMCGGGVYQPEEVVLSPTITHLSQYREKIVGLARA